MSKSDAKRYNVPDIIIQFGDYLSASGLSRVSKKNYISDLRFFLLWNQGHTNEREIITLDNAIAYKEYLLESGIPSSCINRRLSSLRTYGNLLMSLGYIHGNPAKLVSNIPINSNENKSSVEVENYSKATSLSDTEKEILYEFINISV